MLLNFTNRRFHLTKNVEFICEFTELHSNETFISSSLVYLTNKEIFPISI